MPTSEVISRIGSCGAANAAGSAVGYLSEEVEGNLRRSADTLAALDQIALLEERLRTLRDQNEDRVIVASLRFRGAAEDWERLPEEKKWRKETVLAILRCTENDNALPTLLRESNNDWYGKEPDESTIPSWIREDDEIFVARLRRKDFQNYHNEEKVKSPVIRLGLPKENNKDSIIELIKVLPDHLIWGLQADQNKRWKFSHAPAVRAFLGHAGDPDSVGVLLNQVQSHILDNEELMLLAAKKSNSSLAFLSQRLGSCRQFALRVAETLRLKASPSERVIREEDCLRYFSASVRADSQVAHAFVGVHGRSYSHVPIALRKQDVELARIACRTYPMALTEVPGAIEKKLTSEKTFMLDIFRSSRGKGNPLLWRLFLSKQLQRDPELGLEAVASECVHVQDLPAVWRCDRDFWLQAVEKNCFLWLDSLPSEFRDDFEFARAMSGFAPIFRAMLEKFPLLGSDRDMWRSFLCSDHSFLEDEGLDLSYFLHNVGAPGWIFGDKELMLLAVSKDGCLLGDVKEPLDVDKEIIEAAIEGGGMYTLSDLSWTVIHLYPELCAKALRRIDDYDFLEEIVDENLLGDEGSDIWENQEILSAWLSVGGHWHHEIPDRFKEDRELMLLTAKHNERTNCFSSSASDAMRRDKEFMLSAIEASHGSLYSDADQSLKEDYDILLTSFAHSNRLGKSFDLADRVVVGFAARVRSRLKLHDIFLKLILCGMSVAKAGDCPLRVLDRGQETLSAFRKTLTEFLDVPNGKELRLLRRASENLALWGF